MRNTFNLVVRLSQSGSEYIGTSIEFLAHQHLPNAFVIVRDHHQVRARVESDDLFKGRTY